MVTVVQCTSGLLTKVSDLDGRDRLNFNRLDLILEAFCVSL